MTEQEIKDILWACKSQHPDEPIDEHGLYCDNLDVIEFTAKVEEALALKYARIERGLCIEFVESLNPEVATKLREKRGDM